MTQFRSSHGFCILDSASWRVHLPLTDCNTCSVPWGPPPPGPVLVSWWTFFQPCRVTPKVCCDALPQRLRLTHGSGTEMPRLSQSSYHGSCSLAKHFPKEDTPAALQGFWKPVSQSISVEGKEGWTSPCTMLLHVTCYFFLLLVMGQ